MIDLGNYAEDATIDFHWSTQSQSGGSSTPSVAGTIQVYKANSTTQSTAGITDNRTFDSWSGIHHVRIDTSADAFYETGKDYSVILSASTIDGQLVNAVLGRFSIENRYNDVNVASFTAGAITAAAIATDAITAAKIAANAITSSEIATDAIGSDQVSAAAISAIQSGLATGGDVQTACTASLNSYDPPTKAELDSGLAGLNDLSEAQVNTQVDTALSDYDAPTKAEMDAKIDALNNISTSDVNAEVVDVLFTDTLSEITGASDIPATPTIAQAVMLEYMARRNDSQSTATERRVFNDAGAEVLDATMSDDGTTFSQGKLGGA